MKNFGQMFKIVWTAQISGKVNYVHSAMTKVNVNMTIGFIECWLKKFRENLECFKSSALTTAGGKYAKRRWDLLHAFPFYKKRSYKKRPIKFFNHKKQQPIEFFKIRNDFLLTTKKWIALLLKYSNRCQKADNSKEIHSNQIIAIF